MASYELEIVIAPPPSIQIECPVCLSLLRDPYQASCCGYSFCKACIERVRSSTRTCPCCVARNFRVFEDKRLKRSLYTLKVHCTNKKNGCQWEGELGQLDGHLNTNPTQAHMRLKGCKFVKIKCLYCCQVFCRGKVHIHQTDHCPRRPTVCKYCKSYKSTYEDVVTNHWAVCGSYVMLCPNKCGKLLIRMECNKHVSWHCPLTVIDCEFKGAGCEVKLPRNEMAAHLRDTVTTHLSLISSSASNLSKSMHEQAQDIKVLRTVTNKLDQAMKESSRCIKQRQFAATDFERNVRRYIDDIKALQTTTNRLNRSTNKSLEAVNRNMNQVLENVNQRVNGLQQQCDQSQEEISQLRRENIKLAARIENLQQQPREGINQPKRENNGLAARIEDCNPAVDHDNSKTFMSLVIFVVIAVILCYFQ